MQLQSLTVRARARAHARKAARAAADGPACMRKFTSFGSTDVVQKTMIDTG